MKSKFRVMVQILILFTILFPVDLSTSRSAYSDIEAENPSLVSQEWTCAEKMEAAKHYAVITEPATTSITSVTTTVITTTTEVTTTTEPEPPSVPLSEVEIYMDMDVSETTGLSREDFQDLMDDLPYDYTGYYSRNAGTI